MGTGTRRRGRPTALAARAPHPPFPECGAGAGTDLFSPAPPAGPAAIPRAQPGLGSGLQASPRPFQPPLRGAEPRAANPAPPRGGASTTRAGLSTPDPPTPRIPKAARLPPHRTDSGDAIRPDACSTAPAPRAPAPRPDPRPAQLALPAQRPGRRVSSGNFAATAGASGVIPRSGREP